MKRPLGFLGKVLSGDGAAHLWYAVMMLQFQLFMPYFYLVGNQNYKKTKSDFYQLSFYNRCAYPLVLLVPENDFFPYAETSLWYLIDRSGLSYLIYGIFRGHRD